MAELIVLVFEGWQTAENMLSTFEGFQKDDLVTVEDAVIAYRQPSSSIGLPQQKSSLSPVATPPPIGSTDVKVKHTHSLTKKFAGRGGAVGLAAGLLLGGPIGGAIAGVTIGAIAGKLKDHGIEDDFVKSVSAGLKEDTSALFILGETSDEEAFLAALAPHNAKVAKTTLSAEDEKRLRDALD